MRYSQPILLLSLLCLLASQASCHVLTNNLDINDWSSFEGAIQEGELNGFFSVDQVDRMINFMYRQFPELILPVEVLGQSVEKRNINMYCLTKKSGDTTFEQEAQTKAVSFLTSLHHPREPLTLTMVIFFMFRTLVEYRKNKTEFVNLLDNNIVCIIPFIGIDGYTMIEEAYKSTGEFKLIRKNRSRGPDNKCPEDQYGVDLNRNYDINWDRDDQGSSPDECEWGYRGPAPFSEPETRAIKDFVERNLDHLKLAVNLHTFGNLWITPSSSHVDDGSYKMDRVKSIYQDFRDHALLPPNSKVGSGKETVGYSPNGDACDWLLGKHGIISYNPELGLRLETDNQFFPPKFVHYDVITQNFAGLFYMFNKLNPVIKLEDSYINYGKSKNLNSIVNVVIFNEAYRDLWRPIVKVSIGITTSDVNFVHSTPSIPINMIEEEGLDVSADRNTISTTAIYTKKIARDEEAGKDKDVLIYTMEQRVSFRSWNYMHLESVLPSQGYKAVYVQVEVVERGKKIYSYWADFEGQRKTMRE